MRLQGRQTGRLELATVPQQASPTRRTALVSHGGRHAGRGWGGGPTRSARPASLLGAVAVEAYCPTHGSSRPAEGASAGPAPKGQAQTCPELFQSRLSDLGTLALAAGRDAVLLLASRTLASFAASSSCRRLLGDRIKTYTYKLYGCPAIHCWRLTRAGTSHRATR